MQEHFVSHGSSLRLFISRHKVTRLRAQLLNCWRVSWQSKIAEAVCHFTKYLKTKNYQSLRDQSGDICPFSVYVTTRLCTGRKRESKKKLCVCSFTRMDQVIYNLKVNQDRAWATPWYAMDDWEERWWRRTAIARLVGIHWYREKRERERERTQNSEIQTHITVTQGRKKVEHPSWLNVSTTSGSGWRGDSIYRVNQWRVREREREMFLLQLCNSVIEATGFFVLSLCHPSHGRHKAQWMDVLNSLWSGAIVTFNYSIFRRVICNENKMAIQ